MTPDKPRTLVAYGGRLGSTAEVAHFVGDVLSERGHLIHVAPIGQASDPGAYDAIIIGSAIRYDRWLPEAKAFVQTHRAALSKMPVAYFLTCMTLAQETETTRRKAQDYADALREIAPEVTPLDIGQFAGALRISQAPWMTRLALRLLSAASGVKEGDYRNWSAIRTWAQGLFPPASVDANARPQRAKV